MKCRLPAVWKCLRICHCISFATLKVCFCYCGYLGEPLGRWFNIAFARNQTLCGIELRTLYSHWTPCSRVMREKLIVENSAISQKNGIRSVVATNTTKLADYWRCSLSCTEPECSIPKYNRKVMSFDALIQCIPSQFGGLGWRSG